MQGGHDNSEVVDIKVLSDEEASGALPEVPPLPRPLDRRITVGEPAGQEGCFEFGARSGEVPNSVGTDPNEDSPAAFTPLNMAQYGCYRYVRVMLKYKRKTKENWVLCVGTNVYG